MGRIAFKMPLNSKNETSILKTIEADFCAELTGASNGSICFGVQLLLYDTKRPQSQATSPMQREHLE